MPISYLFFLKMKYALLFFSNVGLPIINCSVERSLNILRRHLLRFGRCMMRRKIPDIYFHKQKRKRTASFFTLSFYSTPHHSFGGRNPLLVFTITLSNTMNMDGSTKITTTILISAPRAIRIHKELIISILE